MNALAAYRQFDLNAAAARVHEANAKWWVDIHTGERIERNPFEILALVHSELSEALEGERKSKMDDHLPHRPMAEVEMADTLIRLFDCADAWSAPLTAFRSVERVEENRGEAIFWLHCRVRQIGCFVPRAPLRAVLSDRERAELGTWISHAIIGVMSYCFVFGYDLLGAYEEKMIYNANRADHKLEARRAAGGKAF